MNTELSPMDFGGRSYPGDMFSAEWISERDWEAQAFQDEQRRLGRDLWFLRPGRREGKRGQEVRP